MELFNKSLSDNLYQGKLSRRDFFWLSASCGAVLSGCAVNPVSGKRQIMTVSEADEIAMDKQGASRQFSSDYGAVQDRALNQYISDLGRDITARSHRPQMPYSFRAVNANYINAYAFPGGSIAVTRGILVNLKNEAELSALLGHEVGHVNARHTAERMSKGGLYGMMVSGAGGLLDVAGYGVFKPAAEAVGNLGGKVLLASYSRGDERQADELGMEYMVRANQNPDGMIGLMELLISINKHKPSAMEAMFSSHPMSDERYETARQRSSSDYSEYKNRTRNRDRFMDHTESLRKLKPAIDDMEKGQAYLAKKEFPKAEAAFDSALKKAPEDYPALILRARSFIAQEKFPQAEPYLTKAKLIYPGEAQALQLSGINYLSMAKPQSALQNFKEYERALPNDPSAVFFQGLSHDGMQDKAQASVDYKRFLSKQNQGPQAKYAYSRLTEWGML